MRRRAAVVLVLAGLSFAPPPAEARPQYRKEFGDEYAAMRKVLDDVKCHACHCRKKGETTHKSLNEYGRELRKELKVKNVKKPDAVRRAIRAIEGRKAARDGDVTFGDLIRAGRLPATCPGPEA